MCGCVTLCGCGCVQVTAQGSYEQVMEVVSEYALTMLEDDVAEPPNQATAVSTHMSSSSLLAQAKGQALASVSEVAEGKEACDEAQDSEHGLQDAIARLSGVTTGASTLDASVFALSYTHTL